MPPSLETTLESLAGIEADDSSNAKRIKGHGDIPKAAPKAVRRSRGRPRKDTLAVKTYAPTSRAMRSNNPVPVARMTPSQDGEASAPTHITSEEPRVQAKTIFKKTVVRIDDIEEEDNVDTIDPIEGQTVDADNDMNDDNSNSDSGPRRSVRVSKACAKESRATFPKISKVATRNTRLKSSEDAESENEAKEVAKPRRGRPPKNGDGGKVSVSTIAPSGHGDDSIRRSKRQATTAPTRGHPAKTARQNTTRSATSTPLRQVLPDYYEVEEILDDGVDAVTKEHKYLVKWTGYDEPTWEPKVNLAGCQEVVDRFEASKQNDAKTEPSTGKGSTSGRGGRGRGRPRGRPRKTGLS